jgi:hypothetical protein
MLDKDFFNLGRHNELSSREFTDFIPPLDERIESVGAAIRDTLQFDPQAHIDTLALGSNAAPQYPQETSPAAPYVSQAPRPIDLAALVKREDPDGNFSEGFSSDKLWDGKFVREPATVNHEMTAKAGHSGLLSRFVNKIDPYANIDDSQPRPVLNEATTAPEIGLAGPTQPTSNEKYVDLLQYPYEVSQQTPPQAEVVASTADDDMAARQQRIDAARQQVTQEWQLNNEAQKQPSQDRYELAG